MHAEAVELVLALGRSEKFSHPVNALIDARLVLPGDGAGAARAFISAIADAGGADFGLLGGFQVVDAALEWGDQSLGS